MRTFLSTELSVLRGCHVRHQFVRSLLLPVLACVLIGFSSLHAYGAGPRSTLESQSDPPFSEEYDCTIGGHLKSKASREFLDQAISDALTILHDCKPCSSMFLGFVENPMKLLKWLNEKGHIVISPEVPFGVDRHTLQVTDFQMLDDKIIARTMDLVPPKPGLQKPGLMMRPCIYINPVQFMALDIPAEDVGLYGLSRPEARAVGIIHELGHVAGCLQYDGRDTKDSANKSLQNMDCVRRNCVPCETSDPCEPGVLQRPLTPEERRRQPPLPPPRRRRRGGKHR